MKLIYDYSGIPFNDSLELDCYTYKQLLIDGFIYKMKQTEAGREYLEEAWMLTQTKPETSKLKQLFG